MAGASNGTGTDFGVGNHFRDHFQQLPPSAGCVVAAIVSGVLNTLATVAIAYPAHRAAMLQEKMSWTTKFIAYNNNLVLMGVSIFLGIMANGMGPVAVAFPLGVGANLLSNMILQSRLGIANYNKDMTVGTLVLAAAVMMLPDNGPGEMPPDVHIADLLLTKMAMGFIALCFVAMAGGLLALHKGWVEENATLLLTFATVGCTGTVVNNSISKLVQMHLPLPVKMFLSVIYMVIGGICLLVAAEANCSLEDPSLFVPIGAGVNLVLTFLSGICIWGDYQRLNYPMSYTLVYVLVVLGTYLVSSFDVLSSSKSNIAEGHTLAMTARLRRSRTAPVDAFHSLMHDVDDRMVNAVGALLETWRDDDAGCPPPPEQGEMVLRKVLKRGLDRSVIERDALIDLCLTLVQEKGTEGVFRSQGLEEWLNSHVMCFRLLQQASDEDEHHELRRSLLRRNTSTLRMTSKWGGRSAPEQISSFPRRSAIEQISSIHEVQSS